MDYFKISALRPGPVAIEPDIQEIVNLLLKNAALFGRGGMLWDTDMDASGNLAGWGGLLGSGLGATGGAIGGSLVAPVAGTVAGGVGGGIAGGAAGRGLGYGLGKSFLGRTLDRWTGHQPQVDASGNAVEQPGLVSTVFNPTDMAFDGVFGLVPGAGKAIGTAGKAAVKGTAQAATKGVAENAAKGILPNAARWTTQGATTPAGKTMGFMGRGMDGLMLGGLGYGALSGMGRGVQAGEDFSQQNMESNNMPMSLSPLSGNMLRGTYVADTVDPSINPNNPSSYAKYLPAGITQPYTGRSNVQLSQYVGKPGSLSTRGRNTSDWRMYSGANPGFDQRLNEMRRIGKSGIGGMSSGQTGSLSPLPQHTTWRSKRSAFNEENISNWLREGLRQLAEDQR